MKLVIAIVQNQDQSLLMDALLNANIRATKLKSTGSFLRAGNTTFLIGVEDNDVDNVLSIIEKNCKARDQYTTTPINYDIELNINASFPREVEVGGAIVFVVPIDTFYRF